MKNFAKPQHEIAEFTFDMRLESEHNAGLIYGTLRENEPEWAKHLSSKISFDFSKNNPRIQVADLLAREAMKALDNEIGPKKRPIRKSWQVLRNSGNFEVDAFSNEWFGDMKCKLPQTEHMLGMNRDSYLQWLHERNRQHSITNMFHYVDWTAKRDKDDQSV